MRSKAVLVQPVGGNIPRINFAEPDGARSSGFMKMTTRQPEKTVRRPALGHPLHPRKPPRAAFPFFCCLTVSFRTNSLIYAMFIAFFI